MVDLGIKTAVKEWMSEKWNKWVKQPIANKTQTLENSAINKTKPHLAQAQENIYKPVDYYWKQEPFYRGVFWIAIGCLIVLWVISGS